MRFDDRTRADLEIELCWESAGATHRELYHAGGVDLWRDCLAPRLEQALRGATGGDEASLELAPGEAVPPWSEANLIAVPARAVRDGVGPDRVPLRRGRFYPRGVLSGIVPVFRQDLVPARVVAIDGDRVLLDANHPLARLPLRLRARVEEVRPKPPVGASRCRDWVEEAAGGGPGMQAPCPAGPTDFSDPDGLDRDDARDDALFYAAPRLVGHVDARASAGLREEYGRLIPAGTRVLDLMAGLQSHLPDDRGLEVVGLGMNAAELAANPLLAGHAVHDLNREPRLPFPDASFGAVVCSLSWEYLLDPAAVALEACRVLAPGGALAVGVSDRWFPPKVTRLWTRLHPFERAGMVLQQLAATAGLDGLATLSARNRPRPDDDPHRAGHPVGDPVFVVSGRRELLSPPDHL